MIKFIVFVVIVILVVSAFNVDFSFFTIGISNLLNSLTGVGADILSFIANCITIIFSAPHISMLLSVMVAISIMFLAVDLLGGGKND